MEREEYYSRKMDRFSNDKDLVHQSEMKVLIEREEINLFSMLRPTLSQDGDAWICLYGDDLATGVVGCGDTPYEAIIDWNKAWHKKATVVKRNDKVRIKKNNEWNHKIGEIVRVHLSDRESYMIAFYKRSGGLIITSGLATDYTLHLNDGRGKGIYIYPQYKVTPASEDDKSRLLTALSEAGYRYNEETHEVEKIRWKPEIEGSYWTFNAARVLQDVNNDCTLDKERINNNLAFKTQQEAQEFFDQVKELAKKR